MACQGVGTALEAVGGEWGRVWSVAREGMRCRWRAARREARVSPPGLATEGRSTSQSGQWYMVTHHVPEAMRCSLVMCSETLVSGHFVDSFKQDVFCRTIENF